MQDQINRLPSTTKTLEKYKNLKRETVNVKRGITWTLMDNLGDLDFADDIVFLAHCHKDIQWNTKLMKINARSDLQVTIDNKNIKVQEFVYLGSMITIDRNPEMDVLQTIQGKRGICGTSEHLEAFKDWNRNQTKDFQEQCSWSPSIWCTVLEGVTIHMLRDRQIPNKMS